MTISYQQNLLTSTLIVSMDNDEQGRQKEKKI